MLWRAKAYVRRLGQGLSKAEIMRCRTRYVARAVFHQLCGHPAASRSSTTQPHAPKDQQQLDEQQKHHSHTCATTMFSSQPCNPRQGDFGRSWSASTCSAPDRIEQ
jgi:hypothetical protein